MRQWRAILTRAGVFISAFFALSILTDAARSAEGENVLQGWEHNPALVKKWKESPSRLPAPPPATKLLLPVPLGPADTLKLFMDPASLSRLSDGVLRLTLVIESSGGTRNVFFDGIRCETREYTTYAVGKPDGSWLPIKRPEWRAIPYFPSNAFRYALLKHYVCSKTGEARKPDEIVQLIRFPPPPSD